MPLVHAPSFAEHLDKLPFKPSTPLAMSPSDAFALCFAITPESLSGVDCREAHDRPFFGEQVCEFYFGPPAVSMPQSMNPMARWVETISAANLPRPVSAANTLGREVRNVWKGCCPSRSTNHKKGALLGTRVRAAHE